jgi:hypothetical protein
VPDIEFSELLDQLANLQGQTVHVEWHALGSGPAPRAVLSGTAGALTMTEEHEADQERGLAFLPIGNAESTFGPSGIYVGHEYFNWAHARPGVLEVALRDQTGFQIEFGEAG